MISKANTGLYWGSTFGSTFTFLLTAFLRLWWPGGMKSHTTNLPRFINNQVCKVPGSLKTFKKTVVHPKKHPKQLQTLWGLRTKQQVQTYSLHIQSLWVYICSRMQIWQREPSAHWKCSLLWLRWCLAVCLGIAAYYCTLNPHFQLHGISNTRQCNHLTVYCESTFKFISSFFFSLQTDIPGMPTLQSAPRKHHQIFRWSKR